MPYKITNVTHDNQYALKRRMASRLQMEPTIAGGPLRLRTSRVLTDAQFETNKVFLAQLERDGVITCVADKAAVVHVPFVMPVPVAAIEPVVVAPQEPEPIALPDLPPAPVALPEPVAPPEAVLPPPVEAPPVFSSNSSSRRDDKKKGR